VAQAPAARHLPDAARSTAAARQPLWIATRVEPPHWVRPELAAEVKYLTWTADNLLRQVVYEGLCEDKPAAEVRREVPYPSPEPSTIDSLTRAQSRKG
jgi:ATP-dependent DNA ligase